MGQIKLATASGGSCVLSPTNTASDKTITVPAVDGTMLTNKTAGTVLQVVNATYQTQESTTSSSWTATSLSASITPSSTNSKILVIFGAFMHSPNSTTAGLATVFRGTTSGTNLGSSAVGDYGFGGPYNGGTGGCRAVISASYLDSPSTTSSQLYTVAFRSESGSSVLFSASNAKSTLTLMEIVG